LPDGVDGRLVEEGNRAQDFIALDPAVDIGRRLDDDDPLDARLDGDVRIDGVDLLERPGPEL